MNRRSKSAGMSLVQLLIALFVGGIVMVGAGQLLINTSRSTQRITDKITASAIGARVKKNLNSLSTLRFSANNSTNDGNVQLRNCLSRNAENCTITSPNNQMSFEALLPVAGKRFRIGGTSDATVPVFYTRGGTADCDPLDPQAEINGCPAWRVNVFFWAKCATGEPTCSEATIINVRFQVIPDSAIQQSLRVGVNPPIKPWPPEPRFSTDPKSFAFSIRVRSSLLGAQDCPAGTIATGYRKTGEINCSCSLGYIQTGLDPDTGQPICIEGPNMKCSPTERVIGLKPDGSPKCAPVSLVETCNTITFADENARCDEGAWLRALDMGQCTAGSNGKKSAGEISCETNQGTCCKEVIP